MRLADFVSWVAKVMSSGSGHDLGNTATAGFAMRLCSFARAGGSDFGRKARLELRGLGKKKYVPTRPKLTKQFKMDSEHRIHMFQHLCEQQVCQIGNPGIV